ncbi:D-alanine--D-alanyl carrier protein ligase [Pseudoalteromonas sp. CIP111854]|uniref:D-alanine--D-alanyl carrier protein ligase n=1 Tax=Pseudoalteromonas holothuriae TaxID=2963714 RepID=A0A9W4QYT8_9GAMM|nr:MupA/Atu3671 family FMN-dependent luciferase-like monooxygenase [Pseudoalteromonas sp. CIP111854]CAH9058833.1 D-alanine--D-alanyl carrier protein ligase [Pseudoalteromonas sp. CIP111854]
MNVSAFLISLYKKNIVITLVDGALKVQCPDGELTADIIAQLKQRKPEIIEFLAQQKNGSERTQQPVSAIPKSTADNGSITASFAQQRLWFIDQLQQGSAEYNLPTPIRIKGPFNQQAAQVALIKIIERHQSLRTVFRAVEGEPKQYVLSNFSFTLNQVDLSAFDVSSQQQQLSEILAQDAATLFDLEHDLMLRASWLKLAESEGVLLFNMHHIATDGWSISLLLKEFIAFYQAQMNNTEADLPALSIQYVDYAAWQSSTDAREALVKQKDYWQIQLKDIPVLHALPTDHVRPATADYQGAIVKFQLDKEIAERAQAFAIKHQLTPFMLLQGVFALLIAKHSHSHDIVLGTPMANRTRAELANLIGYFVNTLVLRINTEHNSIHSYFEHVKAVNLGMQDNQDVPFEQLVEMSQVPRDPAIAPLFQLMFSMNTNSQVALSIENLSLTPMVAAQPVAKYDLDLSAQVNDDGIEFQWLYSKSLFEKSYIETLASQYATLLDNLLSAQHDSIEQLTCISEVERDELITTYNQTTESYQSDVLVHALIAQQAARQPHKDALIFNGQRVSYETLEQRTNQLARLIQSSHAVNKGRIGVCLPRSPEMLVAMLAILKSGSAYVPLDPSFPAKRLQATLHQAQCSLLITVKSIASFLEPAGLPNMLLLDSNEVSEQLSRCSNTSFNEVDVAADDLSYVIFTSGSTGAPKGVMIEHQNLLGFFHAMNQSIGNQEEATWLAMTSISFDISILELLWTLSNGQTVVLAPDRIVHTEESKPLDFSLFYFAADPVSGHNKYNLLLKGAKFADDNDFTGVWVPERHFHEFGDQFPNPSVAAAAVAATTSRIRIRSGSVVLPLHDPIRVAEDWSMVDNLSAGRVELSIASGWHPNDFVFFPDDFSLRHQVMRDKLVELDNLWQGKSLMRRNGIGQNIEVSLHPHPIQTSLPTWITAAGNPETFVYAGSIGANILTHLLGQSLDELAQKIRLYRDTLAQHGFDPSKGKVALMIHTFIGESHEQVSNLVEQPFKNYLKHSIGLMKPLAQELGLDINSDLDAVIDVGYQRLFTQSGLFGTVESVAEQLDKITQIGVDECACLIDFGIDHDEVLENLQRLKEAKEHNALRAKQAEFMSQMAKTSQEQFDLKDVIVSQGITHIQCTPSHAYVISDVLLDETINHQVATLCIGGEALPADLAQRLSNQTWRLLNMYGPTETTIWSSVSDVSQTGLHLAGPAANTQFYVMSEGQLAPKGAIGELYIGGAGVARGYFANQSLTNERFVAHPFAANSNAKVYCTGDLVRQLHNGQLQFIGRVDDQVKLRGFRIELGDIESHLQQLPQIQSAVVILADSQSHKARLVAYVCTADGQLGEEHTFIEHLQAYMRNVLPDYMQPSQYVVLDALPLTPNGKVNRKALPEPELSMQQQEMVPPESDTEIALIEIWAKLLQLEASSISVVANFFELGGHSLLLVKLGALIKQHFDVNLSVIQLFSYKHCREMSKMIELQKLKKTAEIQLQGSEQTEEVEI